MFQCKKSSGLRATLVLGVIVMFVGCFMRKVHPAAMENDGIDPGYLDLQAGWRLRVVTPILKSGGYRLHSLEGPNAKDFDNLSAGPDFLGYETDYYEVIKNGAGVHVEFRSAEIVKDEKNAQQAQPSVRLFDLPPAIQYVRIVYLVRVSEAEHNMAIVGAEDPSTLTATTDLVQAHPNDGCIRGSHTFCSWVPEGISVRPEEWRMVDGMKQWAVVC
jgi:hypothetical protein